jgi:hypothetical protein
MESGKLYTREEIKSISGIDYWREDCLYKSVIIDIRTLHNYKSFEEESQEEVGTYIQSMIDRLVLGGGLPSIMIEDNYLCDGTHRIIAYIKSNKYLVNALERIKNSIDLEDKSNGE